MNDYTDDQRSTYPIAYFTTRAEAVRYLGWDDRYGSTIQKIRVYDTAEEKRAEQREEFRRKALMKLTTAEREVLGLTT